MDLRERERTERPGGLRTPRGPSMRVRIIGLAAVLVVVALVAGMLIGRDNGSTEGASQQVGAGLFTAADLHRLVLEDAATRDGEAFVDLDSGSFWSPYDVASTTRVALSELQAAGLADAYGNGWATSDFITPGGAEGTTLISIAMLFPDAESASQGFDAFTQPDEEVWDRYTPLPAEGLGDEGFGMRGQLEGVPGIGYVWRVDNVLLFVGSEGALSPEVMRGLADEMDTQAS